MVASCDFFMKKNMLRKLNDFIVNVLMHKERVELVQYLHKFNLFF